ncbi:unnamed protein product [Penicillium salamii]|nr:unnamed protein product [Penicillium salamii]CAG8402635.1 unnamed protein product [Penicillium salamii]
MSLRPLGCNSSLSYAQVFRKCAILTPLRPSPCSRDTHIRLQRPRRTLHLADPTSFLQRTLFGTLPQAAHTPQSRNKHVPAQQCRHESSAVQAVPELEPCAHCGGRTYPKIRKPVDPEDPSRGWHCKPCLRTMRVHGHLPNGEQLVEINRRRRVRESGEASKTSPCKHCGDMTAPKSSRKFVDPDDPHAGFHCRPCVRHMHHHGALPSEIELVALKTRRRSRKNALTKGEKAKPKLKPAQELKKEEPPALDPDAPKRAKQSRDPHPCRHCGDQTYSSSKRRLVEIQNPSAGYYCQPCSRCLIETDTLPSAVQIEALRDLRARRSVISPASVRGMKSPCCHCGDITSPGSKRKLVEPKNPDSRYYCRSCAECLQETNALPDEMRLATRKSRERARLSNLKVALEISMLRSNSHQGGSSPTGGEAKTCAHCKIDGSIIQLTHFPPAKQDICSSCTNHFDLHGSLPNSDVLLRRDSNRKARVRIQADIEAGRPLFCYHCKAPRPQFPTRHWKIGGRFHDLVCPKCQSQGF